MTGKCAPDDEDERKDVEQIWQEGAIRKWWYSFASMARSAMSSMVGMGGDNPLLGMSVGFSACRRVSSQSLSP